MRWPDLDAGRIVYMYGGDLWLLDLASGQTRALEITVPSDRVLRQPRVEDASKTLENYNLSKDGKHLCLSSRG